MNKKTSGNIFARVANAKWFQNIIIGVILTTGILLGIETYPEIHKQYYNYFKIADYIVQIIFTIEIIIRILAFGTKPLLFFKSVNNVVDFVITLLFYLPLGGAYASVLRLIRVIRVLRLVTALPRLQLIVGALIKSTPSMGWIALLMFLLVYMFAILGNFLFGEHDPAHFGNLGTSMLTLFQMITLDGWVDIMKAQPKGFLTLAYFVSFILIGTMVVLNLFIGVVLNGFDEVRKEIEEELEKRQNKNTVKYELSQISHQLEALKNQLDNVGGKKK